MIVEALNQQVVYKKLNFSCRINFQEEEALITSRAVKSKNLYYLNAMAAASHLLEHPQSLWYNSGAVSQKDPWPKNCSSSPSLPVGYLNLLLFFVARLLELLGAFAGLGWDVLWPMCGGDKLERASRVERGEYREATVKSGVSWWDCLPVSLEKKNNAWSWSGSHAREHIAVHGPLIFYVLYRYLWPEFARRVFEQVMQ